MKKVRSFANLILHGGDALGFALLTLVALAPGSEAQQHTEVIKAVLLKDFFGTLLNYVFCGVLLLHGTCAQAGAPAGAQAGAPAGAQAPGLKGPLAVIPAPVTVPTNQGAVDELPPVLQWAPARRANPTRTQPGFLGFPIYTHVPGVGSTYGVGFLGSNLFHSRMIAAGALSTGDTSLTAVGINEIHLIPDRLVMNFSMYSTKIPFQLYSRAGLGSADDYFYLLNNEYGGSAETVFYLYERRIQLSGMFGASRVRSASVGTPGGDYFANYDRSEADSAAATLRLQFDFTDDAIDPRKGFKLQLIRDETVIFDGAHSRSYAFDQILTGYVPIGKSNTWALNFFHSQASVYEQNGLSAAELRIKTGLACAAASDSGSAAACATAQEARVQERLAANRFGAASSLGGPTQMRGFPLGRFRGAESVFLATELRLNLTDESTPFDFGFFKGTRSIVQLAPFYELGAASDPPTRAAAAAMRSSYGIGFRLGFSGAIVRADAGFSDEGPQFTFFVNYPWDLAPF